MSEVGEEESKEQRDESGGRDVAQAADPYKVKRLEAAALRNWQAVSGRRTRAIGTAHGAYIRAAQPTQRVTRIGELALDATLRTAAISSAGRALTITPNDYRVKVRTARARNLILFVVDASGSMAARQRMQAVKGAILSLLLDAYQKRDQVGLITFRGQNSHLNLPPTNSVNLAQRQLEQLATGGRTPLAAGLANAHGVLQTYAKRDDSVTPLLVILSDGRANVSRTSQPALADVTSVAQKIAAERWSTLVIDCESGHRRLGLAKGLANNLTATYMQLEELSADNVTQAVRRQLQYEQ